jgi:hypothetical protein
MGIAGRVRSSGRECAQLPSPSPVLRTARKLKLPRSALGVGSTCAIVRVASASREPYASRSP